MTTDHSDDLAAIVTNDDFVARHDVVIELLAIRKQMLAMFPHLRDLLKSAAFSLNSTRLIMTDQVACDLAGKLVAEYGFAVSDATKLIEAEQVFLRG